MKLTQQTIHKFFFIDKNYKHLLKYSFQRNTKIALKSLYNIIQQSFKKYNQLFSHFPKNNDFIKETNYTQNNIIYPSDFNDSDFPFEIISYIRNNIIKQNCYTFVTNGRKVNVYIGNTLHSNIDNHLVIEKMLMWLHILSHYSSHKCSQELSIYLYMTPLKKHLPNKGEIIDWRHVNSAFTRTCRPNSEIVIYRQEEWFKVFIHETFHCFGLDFSHLDETLNTVNRHMRDIFNVNVDILLFESYTEFWAELLNSMFFVYLDNPNLRTNYNKFCRTLEQLVNYHRVHCALTMNQILAFQDINYEMLINQKTNYKEKTNVLAYFVIKSLLFSHFNEMISFCNYENKENILQFGHNLETVEAFCVFIKEKHNSDLAISLFSNLNLNYKNNWIQMDLFDFIF
jgi:hypothetical protein|uniref:Uncharacterized protein n=1 Tax=viral metagenome TaxID=1070528 RepID=A0A6C0IKS4_9ZZZZ